MCAFRSRILTHLWVVSDKFERDKTFHCYFPALRLMLKLWDISENHVLCTEFCVQLNENYVWLFCMQTFLLCNDQSQFLVPKSISCAILCHHKRDAQSFWSSLFSLRLQLKPLYHVLLLWACCLSVRNVLLYSGPWTSFIEILYRKLFTGVF